jgi:hypothetical protein
MEGITPQDIRAIQEALEAVKQTAANSSDIWQVVSAVMGLVAAGLGVLAKIQHSAKVKLAAVQEEQIKGLETRVKDKDCEIGRLAGQNETLRVAAEQQRREQLSEAKATATALAETIRNSTDATNAVAKSQRQTAEAIQSMHRDLVADLQERARGRRGGDI